VNPVVSGAPGTPEDVDAIVDLVARVERAQQAALPDEFMSVFAQDALWTTAHGKRLTGFDEISAFTHAVLPRARDADVTASYEAEHILFVRPDVAAVKVRQRPITRDGHRPASDPDLTPDELVTRSPDKLPGSPLYVLVKDDGRWLIAAAQNTKVVDPETLAELLDLPRR
jgi:uncharacterized protein (TIGR02246 family)